jgi:protein-tyrosine phosphatase
MSRQHLSQSDGRVCDEGLSETCRAGDCYEIASAATSTEEIGNGVYPPARRNLAEHGIGCQGKTARQMTRADYARYDLLVGMDARNIRNMRNISGGDPERKIVMLMDYTPRPGDVADPWYTGDFEATWRDVLEGCQGLLEYLNAAR